MAIALPRAGFTSLVLVLAASSQAGHREDIQEILVTGSDFADRRQMAVSLGGPATDTGDLVDALPGAGINRNGPVSALVQYRGLYGDRVAVSIDGAPALSGGPNAMDAPLSYVSPLLLEEINLTRGIAPVSEAQESLGGSLTATLDRGEFAAGGEWQFDGNAATGYSGVDDGEHAALRTTLANASHKLTALAAHDSGNDAEGGDNRALTGTSYWRSRYDLSYGFRKDGITTGFFVGNMDTRDTGTPALPMDIRVIDTDMAGFNLSTSVSDVEISLNLAHHDVYHEMDNFSLRQPPASVMGYRLTEARGRGTSWQLAAEWQWRALNLQAGLDGNNTTHTATVLNPANPGFAIENFNDAKRDVLGTYLEGAMAFHDWYLQAGLRFNRVAMDSGTVSAVGLPAMAGAAANVLAERFNRQDKEETFHHLDMVISADYPLARELVLQLAVARKNRAPSYQERYLWLPMAATGGLADGRNYVSNPDLDSETATEINLGLEWRTGRFHAAPQLFYRRVDDYIQGVPVADMTVNMISTMMSGLPALMFDNIDAELAGMDMPWSYRLDDQWSLEGAIAYVRGRRRDGSDNLYRIAPLNNRISLVWENADTRIQLESVLYAEQDRVSDFNDEHPTPGYGLINVRVRHQLPANLTLVAAIDNLLDQGWQDHLGGYNRNGANPDIAVGERLYGRGRNVQVGLRWAW